MSGRGTAVVLHDPIGTATDAFRVVAGDALVVHADDLAVTRGDGVVETLRAVGREVRRLEAHLDRLAHFAAALDLPEPNRAGYAAAIRAGVEAATPGSTDTLAVRAVLSRGRDTTSPGGPAPTGWVTVEPHATALPAPGIRVATLARGVRADAGRTAPWLLTSARTLAVAAERGAAQEARRRGADEPLWVSVDGHVLDGVGSAIVLRLDGVWVSPSTEEAVVDDATVAALFAGLADRCERTERRAVPIADLARADAAWLVSAVELARPIVALDEAPLPREPASDMLLADILA